MAAIEPSLIQKLQKLPPQRLAEVADFVDFLAAREERAAAAARLGEALAKLDALNLPPLSDEEIEAEFQAARAERAARRAGTAAAAGRRIAWRAVHVANHQRQDARAARRQRALKQPADPFAG